MIKLKKDNFKMFINGEWVNAEDKAILEAYNPASSEYLANFPDASESDVNKAVDAAREAFKAWRKTTVSERATILNKIADIIDENTELLATTESLDNGKPIRETMAVDVPLSAKHFRYFAGCILADEGQATVLEEKFLSIVLREPIGVVGQIIPWNFPFLMAAWKLAPALAAGNTIVIKPSSLTSLSLLTFVELIQDVLPKGVLNVVTGRGSKSGEFLKNHTGLNALEKIRASFKDAANDENIRKMNMETIPLIHNPHFFTQLVETVLKNISPQIEALPKYTKEAAEVFGLLSKVWLLPTLIDNSMDGAFRKIDMLKVILDAIGIPLLDEEMTEVSKQYVRRFYIDE